MIWISDEQLRKQKQKESATKWAYKIATPWSEHMAYLMGAIKNDNDVGRIIMFIGRLVCKVSFMLPKKFKMGVFGTCMMWTLFFGIYFYATGYSKLLSSFKKFFSKNLFFRSKTE